MVMTKISVSDIKKVREITGISIDAVHKALLEADGKIEEALEILKKQGIEVAAKKSERKTGEGFIFSYVHATGKIGVLLKLFCETDFVARNEQFKELGHELSMHIAATNPHNTGDLLAQSYIRDQNITIDDLIKNYIAKFGENISIGEFYRLEM